MAALWRLIFTEENRNLVAQTGDPTGTGRGGASIFAKLYGDQAKFFDSELKPRIKHTKMGCVSMVNNGNNMHGSQFFLTLAPGIDYLDGVHTVFGEVAEGFDVIKKLNEAFVDGEHRPYQDIRIYHTVVLDDPFDDPPDLKEFIPDKSPEPTQEQLSSVRIGADEKIDDTEGKSKEEIQVLLDDKEAKANAQILEMVGDIPDAEIKPEDNVLFVCKLNPVTTDDDLEIIFSRFGSIKSCEIIKDHKTKESLQYAFIEFEKAEDCESAYFKMDNVLIDDRRIHVDFSQSVSKVKWKGYRGNKPPEQKQETSDGRAEYIVKDRSKKTHYDMVFEDEPVEETSERKKKHKKKKHRKRSSSRSESSSEEFERKKQTEKRRQRSRSPIYHRDKRYDRSEDRQGSRHRTDERNRVTAKYDRNYRERSRSPDRYREKHRDHDRHRDKHKRSETEYGDKKKRHRHSSDTQR